MLPVKTSKPGDSMLVSRETSGLFFGLPDQRSGPECSNAASRSAIQGFQTTFSHQGFDVHCVADEYQFCHQGDDLMVTRKNRYHKFPAQTLISTLVLLLLGAGCSDKEATHSQESAPAQVAAPQSAEPMAPPPVEVIEVVDEPAETRTASPAADTPSDAQSASVDGQKIYQASCQACHNAGVAGAPKLGDKEAWAPRIAKGNEALFLSVKNGLNVMPPKGTCMSCSDEELHAAMVYMIEQGS